MQAPFFSPSARLLLPLKLKFRNHVVAALLAMTAQASMALGSEGHALVARIADSRMNTAARAHVMALLELEPGARLESISTWADEHRNPATAPWHYIDFPHGDCHYQKERDCPDGRCVVEAIERQLQVLRNSTDASKQLTALKYLVHFIGDVHQPLHAGWKVDRGGNSYQLQAFMRGTNLHALWDTGMIRYFENNDVHWATSLIQIPRSGLNRWKAKQVAEESCQIVFQENFYPTGPVGIEYFRHFEEILKTRILLAGERLAQILNELWS